MNPALPGGALTADDGPAEGGWAVSGRVGYAFVPYGRLQQGTDTAPNPGQLAIDVHLATTQATLTAPSATSLDLQLPVGVLATTSLTGDRTDRGAGDLELRVRQGLDRWLPGLARSGVGLGATVGLVAPTGGYVARSGAANLPPEAAALTLGRGVTWALAEADLRVRLPARTTMLVQLSGRTPLDHTDDDFAWGPEVRGNLGARITVTPWLGLMAATDLAWRGGASEPDPFAPGQRLDSANVGGWQWTAAPTVLLSTRHGVSGVVGARMPLRADVRGNQLVPQLGLFAAVSYARTLTAARPASGPVVGTGQITVVDYWATWCAPCTKIAAALAEAAPRWPDVRIVKIDATALGEPGAPTLPAGVTGLPVIEVFDRDGKRAALLTGDDALRVVEKVDALRDQTRYAAHTTRRPR